MDFRIINDETLPKIMELWDYCFEKNDTPFFKWYFNEYCLKENMVHLDMVKSSPTSLI